MVSSRNPVIALVGPTATGKSTLAELLAQRLKGEIISADSMQVYKGMDIGTAKQPPEKRTVRYHCLDVVSPSDEFSAHAYQHLARTAIEDIQARNKQPILCGGTGLYIRAALEDFTLGEPDEDASVLHERKERRQRLAREAEVMGRDAFHAKLASVDPKSAALIHPHNTRRVIRAFEWLEEGSTYAEQAAGFGSYHEVYPATILGLSMRRDTLYQRIDNRVDKMMEEGLLEEVKRLIDAGYADSLTAMQAIGYKELVGVLLHGEDRKEALAQVKQASRRYAKRQLSWFRRDRRILWLNAELPEAELLDQSLRMIAGGIASGCSAEV